VIQNSNGDELYSNSRSLCFTLSEPVRVRLGRGRKESEIWYWCSGESYMWTCSREVVSYSTERVRSGRSLP